MRSLGRISASLEGYTHPRAGLRFARGLCAPSGGSPLRSGVSRVRRPRAHFPDWSIKCFDMPRAPGSKENPHHAGPLTPPGNHIPPLFRQPSLQGRPCHCAALCGKASVNSVTLCRPLPYSPYTAPSKEDGGTLERGTDAYPAPAGRRHDVRLVKRVSFVTVSPVRPYPLLCHHPGRCGSPGRQDIATPVVV
jgi:hypothetical protein